MRTILLLFVLFSVAFAQVNGVVILEPEEGQQYYPDDTINIKATTFPVDSLLRLMCYLSREPITRVKVYDGIAEVDAIELGPPDSAGNVFTINYIESDVEFNPFVNVLESDRPLTVKEGLDFIDFAYQGNARLSIPMSIVVNMLASFKQEYIVATVNIHLIAYPYFDSTNQRDTIGYTNTPFMYTFNYYDVKYGSQDTLILLGAPAWIERVNNNTIAGVPDSVKNEALTALLVVDEVVYDTLTLNIHVQENIGTKPIRFKPVTTLKTVTQLYDLHGRRISSQFTNGITIVKSGVIPKKAVFVK